MWRQHTCYFPANCSTNPDVFSLKPSASQGESSLKISAHRFGGVSEKTNTQTQLHPIALEEEGLSFKLIVLKLLLIVIILREMLECTLHHQLQNMSI